VTDLRPSTGSVSGTGRRAADVKSGGAVIVLGIGEREFAGKRCRYRQQEVGSGHRRIELVQLNADRAALGDEDVVVLELVSGHNELRPADTQQHQQRKAPASDACQDVHGSHVCSHCH